MAIEVNHSSSDLTATADRPRRMKRTVQLGRSTMKRLLFMSSQKKKNQQQTTRRNSCSAAVDTSKRTMLLAKKTHHNRRKSLQHADGHTERSEEDDTITSVCDDDSSSHEQSAMPIVEVFFPNYYYNKHKHMGHSSPSNDLDTTEHQSLTSKSSKPKRNKDDLGENPQHQMEHPSSPSKQLTEGAPDLVQLAKEATQRRRRRESLNHSTTTVAHDEANTSSPAGDQQSSIHVAHRPHTFFAESTNTRPSRRRSMNDSLHKLLHASTNLSSSNVLKSTGSAPWL